MKGRLIHYSKTALLWLSGGLAAIILLFLLAAWIGSTIPRNSGWTEPDAEAEASIEIMVETNGIHTGIVMPVTSPVKDWRETFPSTAEPAPQGELPTHVAIGWGEKNVLLNTPTWADLEVATALRIAFAGGEGLMRVGHYTRPAPSEYHRPLRLRPEEYARLVERVEATLPPLPPGTARITHDSFERGARNYDATGRYTLANTCNQWVSDTLAHAGIRTGWWTPLAGGVMKWVPRPRPLDKPGR